METEREEGKYGECGHREWWQSGRRGSSESADRKSGDKVEGGEARRVRTERVEAEWEEGKYGECGQSEDRVGGGEIVRVWTERVETEWEEGK